MPYQLSLHYVELYRKCESNFVVRNGLGQAVAGVGVGNGLPQW